MLNSGPRGFCEFLVWFTGSTVVISAEGYNCIKVPLGLHCWWMPVHVVLDSKRLSFEIKQKSNSPTGSEESKQVKTRACSQATFNLAYLGLLSLPLIQATWLMIVTDPIHRKMKNYTLN